MNSSSVIFNNPLSETDKKNPDQTKLDLNLLKLDPKERRAYIGLLNRRRGKESGRRELQLRNLDSCFAYKVVLFPFSIWVLSRRVFSAWTLKVGLKTIHSSFKTGR